MTAPEGGGALAGRVERAVADVINPILLRDNGYITVSSIEGGAVTVRMEGMCAGCPQSQVTFDTVIRPLLMQHVPEIRQVRRDDADEEDMLAIARKILLSGKERKNHDG